MNNVKEKIELLEKQLEGAKKLKDMPFIIDQRDIDKDIELIEEMISDYEAKPKENDLVEAIKTIKNHCNNQGHERECCRNCSLGTKMGDCLITAVCPEDWKINDDTKILI
ncbi:hypothetical protein [Clostridium sardiniense]|uniref:hypothetical protein n=1 Tax=Clostridium sardiniense TaxID=29369 RepID=UPI00195AAB1D|nr:hypothetical protein [Clostridium sardiniense]MBM7836466.1 hypothetical protein [Clostridium sardiniense]